MEMNGDWAIDYIIDLEKRCCILREESKPMTLACYVIGVPTKSLGLSTQRLSGDIFSLCGPD